MQWLRTNISLEAIQLALLFVLDASKVVSAEWDPLYFKDGLRLVPPGYVSTLRPLTVSIVEDTVHELMVLTRDMLGDGVLRLEMGCETV
jgi:hypothetical protein